jgi:hypothetical protein
MLKTKREKDLIKTETKYHLIPERTVLNEGFNNKQKRPS